MQRKKMGCYVLDKEIGRGSFSTVWEGHRISSGERVAIKVVPRKKLNEWAQLTREVEALRHLNHPNIVRFLDVKKSSGSVYLILELCGGGDLAQFIRRRGGLPESEARRLLSQIGSGLRELHQHRLIHRDLKPQNILLSDGSDQADVKIADFGFARSLQPQDLAATVCGSPLYMAPEILRLEPYDGKADLWSLGAIFYELLFGKPPFLGKNYLELLREIETSDGPVFPKDVAVSVECQVLLRQLLTCNPIHRLDTHEFYNHSYINLGPPPRKPRPNPKPSYTLPSAAPRADTTCMSRKTTIPCYQPEVTENAVLVETNESCGRVLTRRLSTPIAADIPAHMTLPTCFTPLAGKAEAVSSLTDTAGCGASPGSHDNQPSALNRFNESGEENDVVTSDVSPLTDHSSPSMSPEPHQQSCAPSHSRRMDIPSPPQYPPFTEASSPGSPQVSSPGPPPVSSPGAPVPARVFFSPAVSPAESLSSSTPGHSPVPVANSENDDSPHSPLPFEVPLEFAPSSSSYIPRHTDAKTIDMYEKSQSETSPTFFPSRAGIAQFPLTSPSKIPTPPRQNFPLPFLAESVPARCSQRPTSHHTQPVTTLPMQSPRITQSVGAEYTVGTPHNPSGQIKTDSRVNTSFSVPPSISNRFANHLATPGTTATPPYSGGSNDVGLSVLNTSMSPHPPSRTCAVALNTDRRIPCPYISPSSYRIENMKSNFSMPSFRRVPANAIETNGNPSTVYEQTLYLTAIEFGIIAKSIFNSILNRKTMLLAPSPRQTEPVPRGFQARVKTYSRHDHGESEHDKSAVSVSNQIRILGSALDTTIRGLQLLQRVTKTTVATACKPHLKTAFADLLSLANQIRRHLHQLSTRSVGPSTAASIVSQTRHAPETHCRWGRSDYNPCRQERPPRRTHSSSSHKWRQPPFDEPTRERKLSSSHSDGHITLLRQPPNSNWRKAFGASGDASTDSQGPSMAFTFVDLQDVRRLGPTPGQHMRSVDASSGVAWQDTLVPTSHQAIFEHALSLVGEER